MEKTPFDTRSTPWHPAFLEALQLELQEYEDILEFHPEFPLTSGPLQIDCVVIKKAKDVVIKKNIAVIFREWNILEYKSPTDYISIADFYKVYGYACLYASFHEVPITGLTLSFVESRYPEKLLNHLKNERGYKVAETCPGIYTIHGDILPIQVIDNRKLSADENLWLKSLSNKLEPAALIQVSDKIAQQGKGARLAAYLYVILSANFTAAKEAGKMKNTFVRYAEETGLAAEWEARGREEGREKGREERSFNIAQNMVKMGLPVETVITATQLDPEKVKALYQQ